MDCGILGIFADKESKNMWAQILLTYDPKKRSGIYDWALNLLHVSKVRAIYITWKLCDISLKHSIFVTF